MILADHLLVNLALKPKLMVKEAHSSIADHSYTIPSAGYVGIAAYIIVLQQAFVTNGSVEDSFCRLRSQAWSTLCCSCTRAFLHC
jgi:hypothetical protein